MSVYLIDYENVHFAGWEGIDKLTEEDQVVLFYSDNASTIPMEISIKVARSKAELQYIHVDRMAKNYLDFQLAALAGYMVATSHQTEFVIVSKDTGFEAILDFWNKQEFLKEKVHFVRREQIAEVSSKKAKVKKAAPVRKDLAVVEEAEILEEKLYEEPVVELTPEELAEKEKADQKKKELIAKLNAGRPKGRNNRQRPNPNTQGRKQKAVVKSVEEKADDKKDEEVKKATAKKPVSQKEAPKKETSKKTSSAKKTGSTKPAAKAAKAEKAEKAEKKAVSTTKSRKPKKAEVVEKPLVEKTEKRVGPGPKLTQAEKEQVRNSLKDVELVPSEYIKVYKLLRTSIDKHDYNIALVKAFNGQEKGNLIYKATVKQFEARNR